MFNKNKQLLLNIKKMEYNFNKLNEQKRSFLNFFINIDKFKKLEDVFNKETYVDEYMLYIKNLNGSIKDIKSKDDYFVVKMINNKTLYINAEGKLLYVSNNEDDKKFIKEMQINLYNVKKVKKLLSNIKNKMAKYIKAEIKLEKEYNIKNLDKSIRVKNDSMNKIHEIGIEIEQDIEDIAIRYNKIEKYINANCEYVNFELIKDILSRCENKIA